MKTPKWNALLHLHFCSCNWFWSGWAVHSGGDTPTSTYTCDRQGTRHFTVISTSLDENTLM